MSVSTLNSTELVFKKHLSVARRHAGTFALAGLVVLSVGLRLVPILFEPSMNYPDEIFQAIEQAHRLVYGTGLVPWEFQLKIRSWLLPGTIAGIMEIARIFGDGPDIYLPMIAAAFALLGAAPVVCCFLWCRRLFGLFDAVVGGIVVAAMPDLIYFGARTLSEVVAGHILVIAIYALNPGRPVTSRCRTAVGGALLALVFVLRVQLAPALAVVALQNIVRMPRARLLSLVAAAALTVGSAAMLDAATLGSPLASIWRYVLYNLGYGVSDTFGIQPWFYYGLIELWVWAGALPLLITLALLGARYMPLLLWSALAIVAMHSAIGHKEYRFVYPALLLIDILASIGLAGIVCRITSGLPARSAWKKVVGPTCAVLAAAFWSFVSAQVWTGPAMTVLRSLGHDNLLAASFVAHGPATCGIGFFGHNGRDWGRDGGYTHLDRPVPTYWPKDGLELAETAPGFDTLIYTEALPQDLGFKLARCFGKVCVARRQGTCTSVPQTLMPFPEPVAGLRLNVH